MIEQGLEAKNGTSASIGALFCIRILHSNEIQFCRNNLNKKLSKGDPVIIKSRYGKDLGCVLGEIKKIDPDEEITDIVRIAVKNDLDMFEENKSKEAEALAICKKKIQTHGLEMKLVSAHYLLEESKVLFYFTADSRVDFRELVKDLVSIFKMRIELRQIGVRDESRVIGGLSVCGREYCCHQLTNKLKSVTIKMAKEQNLSLNSMKISGPCGRLLCCLSYEYDIYTEERKRLPAEGSRITVGDIYYKIREHNIISKYLYLEGSDGRIIKVPSNKLIYNKQKNKWVINELDIEK